MEKRALAVAEVVAATCVLWVRRCRSALVAVIIVSQELPTCVLYSSSAPKEARRGPSPMRDH
jgi:hypothetical protein